MRIIVYTIIILMLTACVSAPPNKSICVNDAPKHAHCAMMVTGPDFDVDNSGAHQFTQDGRNWDFDQLTKYQLILPPDSYKAIKEWFLNYCHQHPSKCNYTQAVEQFNRIEEAMKYKFQNMDIDPE